jgi:hypothetical protein
MTMGFLGLLARLAFRLLAEHQRRRSLMVMFVHAPSGTIVFQDEGPGGPAIWVWVGHRQRPRMQDLRPVCVSANRQQSARVGSG